MYEGLGNLGSVNCNVYGIANPDWAAGPHWATSLVNIAAHYAAAILSNSQREEIALGGWSFGGVLAHEVARQLISLGQPVRGVILIDAPCPVDHKPLPPPVIECVLDWTLKPYGSSPTVITRSDHIRSILYSQFESHARFLSEYAHFHGPSDPKPAKTIPYVMIQCEDVLDTTALCGTRYPLLEDQIARAQNNHEWEKFLDRNIKVLTIPGKHFEPFKPDTIRAVSEQMQIAYRMIAVHAKCL